MLAERNLPFVDLLVMHTYAYSVERATFERNISLANITWSEVEKQNIQAPKDILVLAKLK